MPGNEVKHKCTLNRYSMAQVHTSIKDLTFVQTTFLLSQALQLAGNHLQSVSQEVTNLVQQVHEKCHSLPLSWIGAKRILKGMQHTAIGTVVCTYQGLHFRIQLNKRQNNCFSSCRFCFLFFVLFFFFGGGGGRY